MQLLIYWRNLQGLRQESQRTLQVNNICHTETLQGFSPPSSLHWGLHTIIDKEPSQVTREAKEAIHIRRLDPCLNRNIGKMSIPHCFDNLLGAKPKHPWVGELSVAPLPVEEVAPPSQIPGLNLTQFNNIGNFGPNVAIHIPRHSTRACRAKNLFN